MNLNNAAAATSDEHRPRYDSSIMEDIYDVIIVGAGIAGLMAAKTLLERNESTTILLIEASDCIGGRIRGDNDFVKGHTIDLGAEYIHGQGTPFTKLLDELFVDNPVRLEEAFITAHADGGPAEQPTSDGKYGMYYLPDHGLLRHDDHRLDPLHTLLDNMDQSAAPSIGMLFQDGNLSSDLQDLANAGYSNTAGCSDPNELSLPALLDFDRYWEENETEADSWIDSTVGMMGVIERLWDAHLEGKVELALNTRVQGIRPGTDGHTSFVTTATTAKGGHEDAKVDRMESSNDDTHCESFTARTVIVTVPPPLWPGLFTSDLPSNSSISAATTTIISKNSNSNGNINNIVVKQEASVLAEKINALQYLGMDCALKVLCRFRREDLPLSWDFNLQSVVSAIETQDVGQNKNRDDSDDNTGSDKGKDNGRSMLIPEVWFREHEGSVEEGPCVVATGFLTSDAARRFLSTVNGNGTLQELDPSTVSDTAGEKFVEQLSVILSIDRVDLQKALVGTRMYRWEYGYMYPRVGFNTKTHLPALAKPMGRVLFAGEATHTGACCTVQAAVETGVRAAEEAFGQLSSKS